VPNAKLFLTVTVMNRAAVKWKSYIQRRPATGLNLAFQDSKPGVMLQPHPDADQADRDGRARRSMCG
jgi:hypothetical protein